jgi:nondiscriminating glutamyl-tRNA synthetase
LFNWLFARHHGGELIVRIEDTDLERSAPEYETMILDSLCWLGLDWDEGIDVGGANGPYRQRERLGIYRPYVEQLLNSNAAYHCYCSEAELEAERRALSAAGELPRYLGKCRKLTADERERMCAAGRQPVVRFRVPEGRILFVDDLVRGRVEFASDGIGDFIIVKSDGIPTYNFAVVLDDALMGITHVLRGEEHLSNTPRQLLIYDALGFPVPQFAHISLILGEDRSKMSKRHGAVSVVQYREDGYLPEALVNFLALLGWSPPTEREILARQELVSVFSLERVSKSPAVFNLEKLQWMNMNYLKNAPLPVIFDLCLPHLVRTGLIEGELSAERRAWLEKVVDSVRGKLSYCAQVTEVAAAFFGETVQLEDGDEEAHLALAEKTASAVISSFREKSLQFTAWDEETVRQVLREVGKELNVKGKALLMTVRVAVSGRSHGPDLTTLLALLGPQAVARRLASAMENFL